MLDLSPHPVTPFNCGAPLRLHADEQKSYGLHRFGCDNSPAPRKTVRIPAHAEHEGFYLVSLTLDWICPVCGGPRGEVYDARSYDGSRILYCDGWINPCGHVDKYADVRNEASAPATPAAVTASAGGAK
jgi:hypothetical protein